MATLLLSLKISPLPVGTTTYDLTTSIERHGRIESAMVPLDHNGNYYGYGYVTFSSIESAAYIFFMCKPDPGLLWKGVRLRAEYSPTTTAERLNWKNAQKEIDAGITAYREMEELSKKDKTHTELYFLEDDKKFEELGTFEKFERNAHEDLTVLNLNTTLGHLHNQFPDMFPKPSQELFTFGNRVEDWEGARVKFDWSDTLKKAQDAVQQLENDWRDIMANIGYGN